MPVSSLRWKWKLSWTKVFPKRFGELLVFLRWYSACLEIYWTPIKRFLQERRSDQWWRKCCCLERRTQEMVLKHSCLAPLPARYHGVGWGCFGLWTCDVKKPVCVGSLLRVTTQQLPVLLEAQPSEGGSGVTESSFCEGLLLPSLNQQTEKVNDSQSIQLSKLPAGGQQQPPPTDPKTRTPEGNTYADQLALLSTPRLRIRHYTQFSSEFTQIYILAGKRQIKQSTK